MSERDFDSIYADYARLVYWAAYGVVKNAAAASDVSQEVFLRVFQHLKKLAPMTDPQIKGWLYRVAVNAGVDYVRKRRREVLTDEPVDAPLESKDALPEDAYLEREQQRELRARVDALPKIYGEAVLLHYFSNLSYEEISGFLGVSIGTVKSRIFRAKAMLRGAMQIQQEGGEPDVKPAR